MTFGVRVRLKVILILLRVMISPVRRRSGRGGTKWRRNGDSPSGRRYFQDEWLWSRFWLCRGLTGAFRKWRRFMVGCRRKTFWFRCSSVSFLVLRQIVLLVTFLPVIGRTRRVPRLSGQLLRVLVLLKLFPRPLSGTDWGQCQIILLVVA